MLDELQELPPAELDDEQLDRLADVYLRPPAGVNCAFVVDFYMDLWRMGLLERCEVRPDRYTLVNSLRLTNRGLRTLDHYLEPDK